ncbi:MAG: XrtA/PEP-CTERM system exopolysaccharide export protein [Pacificimonas sp.]|nr:XrtA/PEP-CTERM system exopolysaccharide export protein [Pacificimonas sp.]
MLKNLSLLLLGAALAGCAGGTGGLPELPPANTIANDESALEDEYRIGPLDALQIFVWRNPELTTGVVVRPDGRITVPLIDDLEVTGKTPAELSDMIEEELAVYIADPIVQVIVSGFNGPLSRQVRIVGAATQPAAIPYRNKMTLLDLMVAVGGLSPIAAGDRARLVRTDPETGVQREYALRIESLLQDGDVSANVAIEPGDVIIIPESFL